MKMNELQDFFDSKFYYELKKKDYRNFCYEFVSMIKWENDNYRCRSKICSTAKYKTSSYTILEYHPTYLPYSRKCNYCTNVESPIEGTSLHKFKSLPAFFEFVYIICAQRNSGRRISNTDIFYQMTGNAHEVSMYTVEEWRYKVQHYILDWIHGSPISRTAYGIEKFWIEKSGVKKLIIISRQLCPNGHIRAEVYDKDNYESQYHFLQNYIPAGYEILLFNWGRVYAGIEQKFPLACFNSQYFYGDKELMTEVSEKLKYWLKDLSLDNNKRIQLHINECIFLSFYEYLTVERLLYLIVKLNMRVKLKMKNIQK